MEDKNLIPKSRLAQSNLVTAARDTLTRDQRRVFYLYLRHIYLNGWPKDGELEIDHKSYAAIFGIGEVDARKDLRKAIKGFRGQSILITHKEESSGFVPWEEYDWTTSRKELQRGKYIIKINNDLRKFFEVFAQDDANQYTILYLEHLAALKSKWSQRLYENLCQYRTTGFWRVSLEDLLERWSIPKSYHRWDDLYRKVLLPAAEEISAKTNYGDVKVEPIKVNNKMTGRVTGVAITFTPSAFHLPR